MTVDLRHLFVSPVASTGSNRLVQGPNWNDGHNLQQGPQTLLGRSDAVAGQAPTTEVQLDPATMAFVGGKLAAVSPTSLPPSGVAGGDLAGTYPNPTVKPSVTNGQVLTTVGGVSAWAAPAGGAPSGAAGGALTGTYPNPTLVGGPLSNYALASSIPTTLPPSGAAGGDLAGTYPNPQIKPSVTNGQVLTTVGGVSAWATPAASGGTVTTTSVVSANGLAGTVATATTTPAITLSTTVTGMLKGNGTAISAGTAGTDYMTPANVSAAYQPLDADLTALAGLNATAGLVEQTAAATYTKRLIGVANTTDIPTRANADARYAPISVNGTVTGASVVSANGFAGTVATATTTPAITLSTSITGMLKGNGTAISAGVAGTDYITPAGLPTSLPPSGTAGGGLAGTYPNPTIKPSTTNGDVLTTVAGVATWAAASGGSGSYLPLTGGTLTGPLTATTATFSGGDFAVARGVDTATAVVFSGVTKGIRFGFDSATSHIEGVDNTGFGSFQPLALYGTTITLGSSTSVTGNITLTGYPTALSTTAVAAGSVNQAFVKGSSAANFGVYYGSGAPTFAAAANSLYMRSDGNSTTTRMYVNTTGSTTWATVTTSA